MTRYFKPSRFVTMLATAVAASAVIAAEPSVLIQGSKFSISSQDIEADALRMPQEMRSIVLAKPQTVTQMAANLYARRAMAQQAESDALDKDPVVAAALQVARDKVLSDAWMEKTDKANEPRPDVADAMARSAYRAKPDRFKIGEQVSVRHILITGADAASRAKAEKLLADLKAGGDFAQLAKEHSADKSNSQNGGSLGFFTRGKMVPEFESAAFALEKAGDLTGLVETKYGFHIIQLVDKKPAGIRPYEEVKADLVKEVIDTVKQEARVAQAQKMQQGVVTNTDAIADFASNYAKTHPTAPSAGQAQQRRAVK